MQSLLILGRQPEFGIAEIEALYGPKKLKVIADQAVVVDIDPCQLSFQRLGGSLKFAKLLTVLPTNNWLSIEQFLIDSAPLHVKDMPKGKMTLGISLYNFNLSPKAIMNTAFKLKQVIQATGRSVRLVPNKSTALNTAQVIHNKLTNDRSWELLLIKAESQTFIAQTVMVQDIKNYTSRDRTRPYRDARVGMLPPKLAQIIINLASGKLIDKAISVNCDNKSQTIELNLNKTVLDPFVGTGVIPQEAYLMGYDVVGSDINPKMVHYTLNNLRWLAKIYRLNLKQLNIFTGDAKKINWPKFDFVATETNLGKPLTTLPKETVLDKQISDLNNLISKFLINLSNQIQPQTRLCIAVPAWQTSKGKFRQLPLVDQITDLGYNFIEFKHCKTKQLIYCRPDQLVARQLLVIVRK